MSMSFPSNPTRTTLMSNDAVRVAVELTAFCCCATTVEDAREASRIARRASVKHLAFKIRSPGKEKLVLINDAQVSPRIFYAIDATVCEPNGITATVASLPTCRVARCNALPTLFAARRLYNEA